jgi:hypothetical protein
MTAQFRHTFNFWVSLVAIFIDAVMISIPYFREMAPIFILAAISSTIGLFISYFALQKLEKADKA